LSTFAESQVLAFNKSATVVYSELRRNRIRVGAMGLLIATIAIANRMTLLTRNSVDFERVPNPLIDDRISP
jgi:tRNA(fMet)-specific endonuclease VapC